MDTQWFAHINAQTIYVLCSTVVAVLIWIEGQMLIKNQGKLPETTFFHVCSVVDTLWLVVSVAAIYWLDLQSIQMAVPAAYIIYAIAGWIYGTVLLRRSGGMPETPEDLVIPRVYVSFSQSFALIFLSLCLLVLAMPWLPIPELS